MSSTDSWIEEGYIYGPRGGTGYFINDGRIYGPRGYTQFWIEGNTHPRSRGLYGLLD